MDIVRIKRGASPCRADEVGKTGAVPARRAALDEDDLNRPSRSGAVD